MREYVAAMLLLMAARPDAMEAERPRCAAAVTLASCSIARPKKPEPSPTVEAEPEKTTTPAVKQAAKPSLPTVESLTSPLIHTPKTNCPTCRVR